MERFHAGTFLLLPPLGTPGLSLAGMGCGGSPQVGVQSCGWEAASAEEQLLQGPGEGGTPRGA